MTGLTAALAEFIHVKTLDDVPPEALDKAKKAIADTFAVMIIMRSPAPGPSLFGAARTSSPSTDTSRSP
jgi:2-methylcitrate dehydratase PrpD